MGFNGALASECFSLHIDGEVRVGGAKSHVSITPPNVGERPRTLGFLLPVDVASYAPIFRNCLDIKMGRPTGLEPATPRSTILCSNQLSYDRRKMRDAECREWL